MTFELCAHSWPSFDIPQAPLEAVRRLSAQISHAPTDSPAGNSKPTRSQLEANSKPTRGKCPRPLGPRRPAPRPPDAGGEATAAACKWRCDRNGGVQLHSDPNRNKWATTENQSWRGCNHLTLLSMCSMGRLKLQTKADADGESPSHFHRWLLSIPLDSSPSRFRVRNDSQSFP